MQEDKRGLHSNGLRLTKMLLHIVQNEDICYNTLPKNWEISLHKLLRTFIK